MSRKFRYNLSRILIVVGFLLILRGISNMVGAGMAGQPTFTLTTGGLVVIGLLIGLPSCLAYYYLKALIHEPVGPDKVRVETLARLAATKPNTSSGTPRNRS